MPASKYTDAQRAEAVELYRTEGPTAVANKLGIPKNTVVRWAEKVGVRTVRNELTREAVEAKVVDGKLRRQNITHRLYGQVEKILGDLEAPTFRTLLKGAGGSEHEGELDFVPPNDRKTLIQAVGSAMVTTAKLEAVDAGHDTTAADSVVDRLMAGFGKIYEGGGQHD